MASEDSSRLLIRIEASQAKIEKQLASIAKRAGDTARGIENDFQRANNRAASSFDKGGREAEKALARGRAAAANLSFQLNDIATGLASGQSPFRIMAQQGGQVAQVFQQMGGGIRGAMSTLGGAIAGLLNPVGLLSVAMIGVTGVAAQYFAEWATSGKATSKEIEEQAKLIQQVADKWGDALPALRSYADEMKRAADEAERMEATKAFVQRQYDRPRAALDVIVPDYFDALARLEGSGENVAELQKAFGDLEAELQAGTATAQDATNIYSKLMGLYDRTGIEAVRSLAQQFRLLSGQIDVANGKARDAEKQNDSLNAGTKALNSAIQLLTKDMIALGPAGIKAFGDVAKAITQNMSGALAGISSKIQALMAEYDAMMAKVDASINRSVGNVGQLAPLTSNDGQFMDPAQQQAWRANNTQSQFEKDLEKASSAIDGFVNRVIRAENRTGNPAAKNPNSTATGNGQFIESTWLSLFRKYYPAQAANMGRQAILELRKDADVSAALIRKYAEENARILQMAGVHVDEAALQLSHFLGAGDAAKVLKAAPGTPLAGLISQKSINANPTILGGGRTVDDAIAYARRRASGSVSGSGSARAEPTNYEDAIAKTREQIELFKVEAGAAQEAAAGVNDYGFAVAKAKKEQELLNAAKREGKEITPQLKAEISALAAEYANAAIATDQMAAKQKAAAEAAKNVAEMQKQWADIATTAIQGIGNALQDGKITAEEWLQVGVQIIQQLIQMKRLGSGIGGGGGGGLLGGLLIPGILHDGGVAGRDGYGHGRAVSPSVFAGAKRYHRGGVAGLQPGEVPAILQRGEVVLPRGIGRGQGGGDMNVQVGVRVDNDGNLQAYVDKISRRNAATTVRAGLASYDKQLDRSLGGKMANAQTRQL